MAKIGMAMIQPAGNLSLKDILHIKYEGNNKNPRIPVMKCI